MRVLNQESVAETAASYFANIESIRAHQVAVYVMCGGGFIGQFAAERPADFYIDARVGGLPYARRKIAQAVDTLATLARCAGLDPHRLPPSPAFHNCGIF